MCKDNLGCATNQDCGCMDCNEGKAVTTAMKNEMLPNVARASLISNGYAKPSADDYVTTSPSGGSGKDEMVVAPSGYGKKEIVKTYAAREIVVPTPGEQKQNEDNTGVFVAGGLLVLFALFGGKDAKER